MFQISHKTLAVLSALTFLFAGVLHGSRVLLGWPLVLGTWEVPMWLSAAAAVFILFLAYQHVRRM
ncbi:MAG: hypothetical protein Q8P16_00160 [bacterium]|nr:hypothetical protein [bacterium]